MHKTGAFGKAGQVVRGISVALVASASFLCASARGDSYTLLWNPSTSPDVVGYNVYYGGATQSYTNVAPVGGVTNATVPGLLPGATYFFAVTAVDSEGLESVFSNEISYQFPAPLVVSAANQSRTYGAANPTLTGTLTGLQNGDNITATFSTAATSGSPVGTYSTVPTLIDPAGKLANYNVTINNGVLTVSPAALMVAAASTTSLYGGPLPALTPNYAGFVNGDAPGNLITPPAVSTTATSASPVGNYPITASGAASPNYAITYASGTLTVSPAPLTITAASASKLYGAAAPALTANYTGFVNGDTPGNLTTPPAVSTTATSASPVGNYPIIASGAVGANYAITYASGTLTVSPAPLTITAASASKLYGAAVPALTANYAGFVNGDTPGNLTTPLAVSTTATSASPVGSYPITASGAAGANYTFIYIPGSLVVTKASTAGLLSSSGNPSPPGQTVTFTVSLSAVAPGAGTPTGTVQFEVDGAAAGAPVSLSGGTASYTTANLAHGSHTVAGQYAGDGNFLGTTGLLSAPQVIDSPPVAGPVTLHRGLGSGVQVTIANLLTNVSALAGDTVTLVGVSAASANGGTVATNHGWVFYTPAPGFTNTDSFTYLVTDGWTAPVAGTVTVDIVVATGPSRNLDIKNLGNGSVAIAGQGIPGRAYIIEYTTETLPTSNWLTLGTVTADACGAFVLVDANVSGLQFYRARYP